ncbi:carboxypeptidase regulatory-like domain-containing protein [Tahibacter soli]|uniref:Carboxypeptidase regulatory-like domain-containing protein n=1 Tax=Tahibacter soli TaxID=2983605 RepID=A0A9X3YHY7_9GAMM|nr:carboxypeptidase regulatory-like domain-containing protein [Tahibacter soli]MDC8011356.1 carboxypeptidase regulatory-like domain-containing protein [Tahibacter soli]
MVRALLRVVLFVSLWAAFAAPAQSPPPEVAHGLAWLRGQVQADGSITGDAASLAQADQVRGEAALTLALLDTAPPALVARVVASDPRVAEFVARRVMVQAASGGAPASGDLAAFRNADGGFGGAAGRASFALDTAHALQAYAAAAAFDGAIGNAAVARLRGLRRADGGWGVDDASSVYFTAQVLAAAQAWSQRLSVADLSAWSRDFLLARRGADATFGNVADNAVALYALARATNDAQVLNPLAAALRGAQLANGSWADDPWQTALALRALAYVGQGPPTPTRGSLIGRVVDQAGGAALAEVTLQLVEDSSFATSSDAEGRFTLSGVNPGSYTLRASKLGYQPRDIAVAVAAGDTLQLGDIPLVAAPLTAGVFGTVRDQAGNPLRDVLVAAGTLSALTDTAGAFQLNGLSPGPTLLKATKANYRDVSATVDFQAGYRYNFSPTMYPTNVTPPATATLRGRLIDQDTSQPIVGASAKLGSATVTTPATGKFEFAGQAPGAFTLTLSANGYQGVTASGTLSNGVNELGDIRLRKLPSTSTLSGVVRDVATLSPIVGASVVVEGQSASAVSGPDGRYTLSGITGLRFNVIASAQGYLSSRIELSLTQPGATQFDIDLTALAASGLVFEEVKTSRPVYGPSDEIELEVEVKNTTANAAEMIVDADVVDPTGSVVHVFKANLRGAGQFPPNLPLSFAPNSTTEVEMEWIAHRLAAGNYTVRARGMDTSGRVVAEGATGFTVRSEPVLRGAALVDPPLAQAGTSTPVALAADVMNIGNLALPAGTLDLTITVENPDTQSATQPRASERRIAVIAALNNPVGFARDADANLYLVRATERKLLKIDPQGVVSELATLPLTPAALALTADRVAWIASTGKRVYNVTPAGVVTFFDLVRLTAIATVAVAPDGSAYFSGQFSGVENGRSITEQRLVRRAPAGDETVLWRNGLAQPAAVVAADNGDLIVANYGDDTLARVTAQGAVAPFASGLNRPQGLTRGPDGAYYVSNSGNGTIARVSVDGATVTTYATGLNQPYDLKFGDDGTLYVANNADDSVVAIDAAGTRRTFAKGIANRPTGMRYDAAGDLYIVGEDNTLRRKRPDGTAQVLATGLASPQGFDFAAPGVALVANYSDGTVAKVEGGTRTAFATGLRNPRGVAVNADGEVYVTEGGANRIARFDAAGTSLGPVDSVLVTPTDLRVDGAGRVFVRNTTHVSVLENGAARIFVRDFPATSLAIDPAQPGVVALRGADLYRIGLDGVAVKIRTLPASYRGIAVDAGGFVIINDYSNRRLQRLNADGTQTVIATLTDLPDTLVSTPAGTLYVKTNTRKILRVEADGTTTQIAYAVGTESLSDISPGADGKLLAWTGNRLYEIDPAAGTTVRIKDVVPSGATRLPDGRVVASFSGDLELATYDAATYALVSRIDGFVAPWDILWNGTDYRFIDNGGRFYQLARGGYPVKLGLFNGRFLTRAGSEYLMTTASNVQRWTGTGAAVYVTPTGNSSDLQGVAGRPDGSFAVADRGYSRVIEYNASRVVVADHAGIVRPVGLAFDAQGRLHVANNSSGTVARLSADGAVTTTVTRVSAPRYLAFDAQGRLWISNASAITRIGTDGVATTVGDSTAAQGLYVDATRSVVVDQSAAVLRRLDANVWKPFAAGLVQPKAMALRADGRVLVADNRNGSVLEYANGELATIVVGMSAPGALALDAEDRVLIGRGNGFLSRFDGTLLADLRTSSLLNDHPFAGIVAAPQGKILTLNYGYNSAAGRYETVAHEITIVQAAQPPAPGSVVHTASLPMNALDPSDDFTHFDFGSWMPPYGGDFKVSVRRADIGTDEAVNFVHVGPHAVGELTAAREELPPGDRELPMCLRLTGADFTSLSRVEVSQARLLANIVRPNGMAADRAGNLYFTDETKLYRTSLTGQTTTVVDGLSTAFGLAIDDDENLYLPNDNATTRRVDLVRVDPNGVKSVVADLGVARANGVVVNSRDEILVGSPGKLIKVTRDGTVAPQTVSGMPDPRGITIDGQDNVYVQNEQHLVAMIKPDGSAFQLYSYNVDNTDPYFEGDGYPNIAADCADNMYIAPYNWARIGQNNTEEHSLAQIVARTGQVGLLFDTLRIHPTLTDIDYLAYDRFGDRLLFWQDYSNQIWQVPVTCGAIGVNAHLVTRPGQRLSGMTRAPAAVVPKPDGSTEYVWNLRDVTAQGDSVCFDAEQEGLVLGERRKTLADAFVTFQNSFSADDIRAPVDVPYVRVGNLTDIAVSTDAAEYRADETALVTTTLATRDDEPVAGRLVVDVYDAAGVRVGGVVEQMVTVPPLAPLPLAGNFGIGRILPGEYVVKATLVQDDAQMATAQTSFVVLPDDAQGTATSTLATDKFEYLPDDVVAISSRVTSLSQNVILEALSLTVRVFDASGTQVFGYGHPIEILLPGATREFVASQRLANAPAGSYRVEQVLTDAAGHVFDTRETTYIVSSSAGNGHGLRGTVVATPAQVEQGNDVAIAANAENRGNADLAGVVLKLTVIDPDNQAVIASWQAPPVAIARNASAPMTATWPTTGIPAGDYVVVFGADVAGGSVTLAHQTVRVVVPSVQLAAQIDLVAQPRQRALALIDAAAPQAQRAFVLTAASAVGYELEFVTNPGDFDTGLRSGVYQLYLLLGADAALDATTQRLLREAVHRGEGLIVASGAGVVSDALAQTLGIAPRTRAEPAKAETLRVVPGAPLPPASMALAPPLAVQTTRLTAATPYAEVDARMPATPELRTLAEAVALNGRVELAYSGSDGGINGTGLRLEALGRLRNADGTDRYTIWRVRNGGTTLRSAKLASVDGTWSRDLDLPGKTETWLASPVVAGDASHRLTLGAQTLATVAATSGAFTDARIVDAGTYPGAIALWANATSGDGIEWSGSQNIAWGAVHSNASFRLNGAQNVMHGPVRYVQTLQNAGASNTFDVPPRRVAPHDLPLLLDLNDYRPGGRVAAAAGAKYVDGTSECAKKGAWRRSGANFPLPAGVYWIPCDVEMSGASLSGNATIVATGTIQLSGASANFSPYFEGLQFGTLRQGGDGFKVAAASAKIAGLVYSPYAGVELSGARGEYRCAVVGDRIRISGAAVTFDPRACALATVQERMPAIVAHGFGQGRAAYASFDWTAALATYDANATGFLSHLFDAAIGESAPAQPLLRTGAALPVDLRVRSLRDGFRGSLRLAAAGDATIALPVPPQWLVDLTQTNAFETQALVLLGSGTHTALTATVAATAPIAVDPLATQTLDVGHAAGESIADVIAAVTALGNRDAPLDASLAALVRARDAQAPAEKRAALLDAAEAAGRSAHANASSLRTRIDWLIWGAPR